MSSNPSPDYAALPARELLYVVKASHHLNFYPGTLTPTPPEYRRTLVSEPMARDAASNKWIEWIRAVASPGWDIRVEPLAPASPAAGKERAK